MVIFDNKIMGYEMAINTMILHKYDMGAKDMDKVVEEVKGELKKIIDKINQLPNSPEREKEPSSLEEIRALSKAKGNPAGLKLDKETYLKKLKGAIVGRFAGCALGSPVEFSPMEAMQALAGTLGMEYPPTDYWEDCPDPYFPRYKYGKGKDFTRGFMKALPPDDDITYTMLALLIMEKYGDNFTVEDIAQMWKELLPPECVFTAERKTLENLAAGISPYEAGGYDNPEEELIGADIRCDGWAYVNPLDPMKATEFAHRDAYLSHRRTGIYGAMYFAAVISLAFGMESLRDAFENGLDYVPTDCMFAKEIRWALDYYPNIKDYQDANKAIKEHFPDMNMVHTINNACLTIWGALLGEHDFTKGIGQTVAMGFDNDCTGATVGSILGAYLGIDQIPENWYKPWNDTAVSYLNGIENFKVSDIVDRYFKLGKAHLESGSH